MKLSKIEKEERAKRFNISLATYYNWEKAKPELIKVIELGLEYENLKEDHEIITKKQKKEIEEALSIIPELMETVKNLKEEVKTIKEKIK